MFERLFAIVLYIPSLSYSLVRNYFNPEQWKRFDKIEEKLWLGMLPFWFDVETFKSQKIDSVVTMNEDWELFLSPDFKENGFDHLHLPTVDHNVELKQEDIKAGVKFIDEKIKDGKTCLVHCKAGRGRSVVLVACYLIHKYKYTPYKALEVIQEHRPQINIPLGANQMKSLYDYYIYTLQMEILSLSKKE